MILIQNIAAIVGPIVSLLQLAFYAHKLNNDLKKEKKNGKKKKRGKKNKKKPKKKK